MSQSEVDSAEHADASLARRGGPRPVGLGRSLRSACGRALAGAAAACLALGCATSSAPKKACLLVEPSETLNLYDGQPHALTIYIYPLADTQGFEQTPPDDLLAGARPPGVIAPPVPLTVEPSDVERSFQELFPVETTHLGVIADYERAPGDPEGVRSRVVPARCGIFKPKITLSSRDIEPE